MDINPAPIFTPNATTTVGTAPQPLRLAIYRTTATKDFTAGTFWIDGVETCKTLEDPIRDIKIMGETAIPTGEYTVTITYSPKFGRRMPLITRVAGFTGIRMHCGNTVADTAGCPLLGMTIDLDKGVLKASKQAYDKVFAVIEKALAAGRSVNLTIK